MTLKDLISMNKGACIIGINSFDGNIIDESELNIIANNSTRNEVLKDSVTTRLYTDDAKYDLYILDEQPVIVNEKEL